jgi:hypothetical protein
MKPSELKSEKEKIYDEQISPLIQQIIEICKEHKIPMFTNFGFAPVPQVEDEEGRYPADSCVSSLLGEGYDHHWVYEHFNVLHQCRGEDGVNVDKYFMWLEKQVKEQGAHGSIYLAQLGIKPETGERKKD